MTSDGTSHEDRIVTGDCLQQVSELTVQENLFEFDIMALHVEVCNGSNLLKGETTGGGHLHLCTYWHGFAVVLVVLVKTQFSQRSSVI